MFEKHSVFDLHYEGAYLHRLQHHSVLRRGNRDKGLLFSGFWRIERKSFGYKNELKKELKMD